MATAAKIIEGAMRKLGVVASGEEPSSAEQQDALEALNDMVESFSNESLMIYQDNEETFPLVPSQSVYTMGTGGDFDTERPLKIIEARLKVDSANPYYELPVSILQLDEWRRVVQKNVSSNIQTAIYPDYQMPLVSLTFYPVPSYAQSIILNSMKVLREFTGVGTEAALPPGYDRMLIYNLAVEMAPEFGVEPSPTVQRIAAQSKGNLKRLNAVTPLSRNDLGDMINGAPWNWLTGE